MRSNELRLGNLVLRITHNPDSKYSQEKEVLVVNPSIIAALDRGPIQSNYKGYTVVINPIPITEQGLEDLGFKLLKSPYRNEITYQNKGIFLHKRKRGWVINKRFKEPKYIHEVQNLYFALKGEELIFK